MHKKAFITAGVLLGAYILDIWLIAPLAALIAASNTWASHGMQGVPDYALAGWYLNHPLITAWSWLQKGNNLSQPEVRLYWLYLNGFLVAVLAVFYLYLKCYGFGLSFRTWGNTKGNRDITALKLKPIKFQLAKYLALTPADQIFLGLDDQRRPVTIPVTKLTEHVHILGGSGTGKTSLAVLPICLQAIKRGLPVITIDFKGDEQAIKLLARETRATGKRFYLFSLHPDLPSCTYNPLASGSVISKVERIMTALELVYEGEAKFYSYVQQSIFIPLLQILDEKQMSYTIWDIHMFLSNPELLQDMTGLEISPNQLKGLTAALTPYIDLPRINDPGADLDLGEIMKRSDVCYFDLRSAIAPTVSSALGKMIAMDLQGQAIYRNEHDVICLIAVDEFQNIACDAFRNVIAKVRSANYGMVLANQALGDLAAVSRDFANVITTNTATKIIFNVEDPADAEYLARRSGHVLQRTTSFSENRGEGYQSIGESYSEVETYYLHPNIFLKMPFGKSVIFRRGQLATIANHTHLLTLEEKIGLQQEPYPLPPANTEKQNKQLTTSLIEEQKEKLVAPHIKSATTQLETEVEVQEISL